MIIRFGAFEADPGTKRDTFIFIFKYNRPIKKLWRIILKPLGHRSGGGDKLRKKLKCHEAFEVQTFKFYSIAANTFKFMTVNADKKLTL